MEGIKISTCLIVAILFFSFVAFTGIAEEVSSISADSNSNVEYAPYLEMIEPDYYNVSNYIRNDRVTNYDWAVINYTYDFQHDVPPQNLVLHLDGTFDNTSIFRSLNVHVIRPDGEMISFSPEARGGFIDIELNLINKTKIYDWAYSLGVVDEDIPEDEIYPERVLFGKNDTEILSPNPSPLRGEYTIHITFLTEDIEFNFGEDEGRLIIDGKKYSLDVDTKGEGSVPISPEQEKYEYGTEVNLTAVSGEGWEFEEWQGIDKTGEEITVTIDEDMEITAVFEKEIDEEEDEETPGFTLLLLLVASIVAVAIYQKKIRG